MYPNIMAACNYDKETKLMTVLQIEGFDSADIIDLCGHMTAPEENSVYLGHKFLNLPNYHEMGKMFDSRHTV